MDIANIVITTVFALLELLGSRPGPTKDATVVRPPVPAVELIDCPAIDPVTRDLLARCEFYLEPPLKE